jgi:hypothetical protein
MKAEQRIPLFSSPVLHLNLFIVLILFLSVFSFAQSDADIRLKNGKMARLKLTGTVKNIEISENKSKEFSRSFIYVHLNFRLKNTGEKPILLFNQNPGCLSVAVAQKIEELENRNGSFSFYRFATSSSFIDDKMWKLNKDLLDIKKPPSNKIFSLLPEQSIEYEDGFRLDVPKEESKRFEFSPWERKTLSELKQLSPVFIKLQGCSVRGYGINEAKKDRFLFAQKLQKRWMKYGYLWLEDVVSEPIQLDLNNTIF